MKPKPKHLGPEYASAFQDKSLVEVYHLRPPYSPEVFDLLVSLIPGKPRTVLDVGCGTGNIARPLAPLVDRVDAVDCSEPMIAKGRSLPGGDHPTLHWICGNAEEVPLHPPYALVTAASSLHWVDWERALPRFHNVLSPNGYLAIIHNQPEPPPPWLEEVKKLVPKYSTNPEYRPVDLVEELESRGLFQKVGEKVAAPMFFRQTLEDYIESFQSTSLYSRDRMDPEKASAFDREVRDIVRRYCREEEIEMQFVCKIIWGKPLRP
jgi:SAM-dependent methyltransferase